jgi:protein-L-isoaspartate O-methyltransferase
MAVALWWRTHPSACPYSQRFWVEAPHPLITRLRDALAPVGGERLLEVGPGTGYYTLPVARWLGPDGVLEVLDLQREMLDHTMRAVRERGLGNVIATEGDARMLPYEENRFDGAFLVATLGEVPDQNAALRELARVIKSRGRLVVESSLAIRTGFLWGRSSGERAARVSASSGAWAGRLATLRGFRRRERRR